MHSIQPHGIDPIIPSYHLLPKGERTPNTRPDGLIGKNLAEMLPNSCRSQSMCEITRMSPHEDVIRPRLNVSVPSPNF